MFSFSDVFLYVSARHECSVVYHEDDTWTIAWYDEVYDFISVSWQGQLLMSVNFGEPVVVSSLEQVAVPF